MTMGKFEEELVRMQEILRHAKSGSLILLNETFATTTEIICLSGTPPWI
ncbi:MAG: hypothetical protein ACLSG9_01010 [Eubacterium sp.]